MKQRHPRRIPEGFFRALKLDAGFVSVLLLIQLAVACFLTYGNRAEYSWFDISVFLSGALGFIWWRATPRQLKESSLGLKPNNRFYPALAVSLGLAAVYFAISLVIPWSLGIISFTRAFSEYDSARIGYIPGFVVAASAAFMGYFMNKLLGEELIFRGYLLEKWTRMSSLGAAVCLNSVVFVAWHLPYWWVSGGLGGSMSLSGYKLAVLFVGNISLCLIYLSFHNLYAISIYHALMNMRGSVMFVYNTAGTESQGAGVMFHCQVHQPGSMLAFHVSGLIFQLLFAAAVYYWSTCSGVRRESSGKNVFVCERPA
jgi:membrane protease YdiL (CAAX protease family)